MPCQAPAWPLECPGRGWVAGHDLRLDHQAPSLRFMNSRWFRRHAERLVSALENLVRRCGKRGENEKGVNALRRFDPSRILIKKMFDDV